MPPLRLEIPSYRKHSSGQARITLTDPDGRREDILLGPFNSAESRRRYDQELVAWIARGRTLPKEQENQGFSNNALLLAFMKANLPKYDTRSSDGQIDNLKTAGRYLRKLYGTDQLV